jgi:hypothetical protein
MRGVMPHAANPFRLTYRSFDRTVYDRIKSDSLFALRGFDLACVGQLFPGYVLERPATPHPGDPRVEVLAEVGRVVFLVIYTRLGRACRLTTGWVAEPSEAGLWFHPHEPPTWDAADLTTLRGRVDFARLGTHHLHDREPRPVVSARDLAETRAELTVLYRRLVPPREPLL